MSKTCGIELKGNEARIVVLEGDPEDYVVVSTGITRITLEDPKNQDEVRYFFNEFVAFLEDGDFDRIGIKERVARGRFAGGTTSFKMEGLIQNTDFPVEIIHQSRIKAKLKDVELDISNIEDDQIEAMKVAWYLMLEPPEAESKSK
jgi:hypothetical protein